jgi:hypothetical protein
MKRPPRHVQDPVYLVDPDTLELAEENPEVRTTSAATRELEANMALHGPLPWLPVVMSAENKVGDGHRRVTVARKLKAAGDTRFNEIPVMFTEIPLRRLWAMMNIGKRPVRPQEWLHVYLHFELLLGDLPQATRRQIDMLEQLVGRDGLWRLYHEGGAPPVWTPVDRLCRHCKQRSPEAYRLALWWCVKHRMQDKINKAIKAGMMSPEQLWAYVRSDRPFPVIAPNEAEDAA